MTRANEWPLLVAIDDDAAMREIITEVAKRCGYDAIGASGPQNIAVALEHHPEVIVLDISMPDMDGIEVIQELARRKSPARLLILSGTNPAVLDAAHEMARCYGLNLVATMTKPADIRELGQVLQEIATEIRGG